MIAFPTLELDDGLLGSNDDGVLVTRNRAFMKWYEGDIKMPRIAKA